MQAASKKTEVRQAASKATSALPLYETGKVSPVYESYIQRKAGCACGGACPKCRNDRFSLQPKLSISQPNDSYELEADRVAEQVMRMPEEADLSLEEDDIMHTSDNEESEEQIQTSRIPSAISGATGVNLYHKSGSIGTGQPLPAIERAFFEPRFGRDFGHVRVHTGLNAQQAAQSIQARAYTLGSNIVFGTGQYAPATHAGRKLLAHELTHVVQQSGNFGLYAHPYIQRKNLRAGAICNLYPGQYPILVSGSSQLGTSKGRVRKYHKLGPFSCESPRYEIKQAGQVLGNRRTMRKYLRYLVQLIAGDKQAIEWIYNSYLKNLTPSTTLKYRDFKTKLQAAMGLTGGGTGGKQTATVGGETQPFIDENNILKEWQELGEITKVTGLNPFDKWATRLHEQHHESTIKKHPDILQANLKIREVKQDMLKDPALKDEHSRINKKAWQDIPKFLSFHHKPLIPNYPYTKHVTKLRSALKTQYGKYESWMANAYNFATEDLKAYCLSWNALQTAVSFIRRCLRRR